MKNPTQYVEPQLLRDRQNLEEAKRWLQTQHAHAQLKAQKETEQAQATRQLLKGEKEVELRGNHPPQPLPPKLPEMTHFLPNSPSRPGVRRIQQLPPIPSL
jgi:hypothetical protein